MEVAKNAGIQYSNQAQSVGFKPDGDGWRWEEKWENPNSDNWMYTERFTDNWYYYEAGF